VLGNRAIRSALMSAKGPAVAVGRPESVSNW